MLAMISKTHRKPLPLHFGPAISRYHDVDQEPVVKRRGLNSPGARQAFGAPQNGPGRAASLERLIGSGRSSKNLDAC
jgi:hypothetical protein